MLLQKIPTHYLYGSNGRIDIIIPKESYDVLMTKLLLILIVHKMFTFFSIHLLIFNHINTEKFLNNYIYSEVIDMSQKHFVNETFTKEKTFIDSSVNDNASEFLQYLTQNGIINLDAMRTQYENMKRKELLAKHPYEIWEGSDGKWRTYLKENGSRKMVKRSTQKSVEDVVIQHLQKNNDDVIREKEIRDMTLYTLFPEWLKYKEVKSRASSYIKKISADWKKFYIPETAFIHKPLRTLTKIDIDTWLHSMIKKHAMTKKTFYNMQIILKQGLAYAFDCGYISNNPFEEVEINTKLFLDKKKDNSLNQVYLEDEVPLFLDEMLRRFHNDPTSTAPLAILLDFELGLRVGELVALKHSDISGRYLHIQRQEVSEFSWTDDYSLHFDHFKVVEYTKSDDGDRELYLTDTAIKIIEAVKAVNENYGYQDEDYLFVKNNMRINQRAIASRIKRGCEHLDMMVKTSHKIRKTVISKLIDDGINIDEIRKFAGHAHERTTYGSYCFNRKAGKKTEEQFENALNHGYHIDIFPKGNQGNQKSHPA